MCALICRNLPYPQKFLATRLQCSKVKLEEFEKLAEGNTLPNDRKILALKLQLDEDGLLRLCGRL